MSKLRVDELESLATGKSIFVDEIDSGVRADLTSPDKGAAMVARGVVAVDSIADLLALPEEQRKEGLRYLVRGYHAGTGVGGGVFYWDASRSKADHNGGTVIEPDKTFPDFTIPTEVTNWFGATNTGTGVFVRVKTFGSDKITDFGASEDFDNYQQIQACVDAQGILGSIHIPRGTFGISQGVSLGDTYVGITGETNTSSRLVATQAMPYMLTGGSATASPGRRLIEKVYFDGKHLADIILDFREDGYMTVQNCDIVNPKVTGCLMSKWANRVINNNFTGYDFTFSNTTAFDNTCLEMNAKASTGLGALNDVTIWGNVFQRCNIGLRASDGHSINVLANEFDVCNSAGIYSNMSLNIESNYFERCGVGDSGAVLPEAGVPYHKAGVTLRGPIVVCEQSVSTAAYPMGNLNISGNRFAVYGDTSAISLSNVTYGSIKNNSASRHGSGASSSSFVRLFGEGTGFLNRSFALEIEQPLTFIYGSNERVFDKLVSIDAADFNSSNYMIEGYLCNLNLTPLQVGIDKRPLLINDLSKIITSGLTEIDNIYSKKWTTDGSSLSGSLDIDLNEYPSLKGDYIYIKLNATLTTGGGYDVITVTERQNGVDINTFTRIFTKADQALAFRSLLFYVPEDITSWGFRISFADQVFTINEFSVHSASLEGRGHVK